MERFCGRCEKDARYRETQDGADGCPIVAASEARARRVELEELARRGQGDLFDAALEDSEEWREARERRP